MNILVKNSKKLTPIMSVFPDDLIRIIADKIQQSPSRVVVVSSPSSVCLGSSQMAIFVER